MKKSIAVLALALALTGSLAACSNRDPNANNTTGGAGSSNGSASGSAGQVARRYGNQSVYNGRIYDGRTYGGRTYFEDGRYTAGSNGQVYDRDDSRVSRDLTRDARDIVRDTGDAIGDIGRGIGDMITGNDTYSGTPSWEPDSSAVRY